MSHDTLRPIIIHFTGDHDLTGRLSACLAQRPELDVAVVRLSDNDPASIRERADLVVACVGDPTQLPAGGQADTRQIVVLGDMMDSLSRKDILLLAREMHPLPDDLFDKRDPTTRFTGFGTKRSKKQRRTHR